MSGYSNHTASSITFHPSVPLVLIPLFGTLLPVVSANAQIVTADDATRTAIDVVGDRTDITGGQLSGDRTNLFHSFQQFDLSTQQTANFVTPSHVQNVLGRIDSSNASSINGTLQVSGSEANLYLMNPAGILIGPDAQLNLSGGFTATTATGIGFESLQEALQTEQFTATGSYSPESLNGEPGRFYFETQQAGAVVNQGDLSVKEGQSLNLIGGTVVNTGTLSAPEGSITVAAVEGESFVRLSQGDQLLSLEVESLDTDDPNYSSITPTSLSEMLTGSESTHANALITNADGSVRLAQSQSTISETGGSAIVAGTLLSTGKTGGNINVLGTQVELYDATLNASGTRGGGLIRVGGDYQGAGPIATAHNTLVDSSSVLLANALQNGNGGTIITWADQSTLFGGSIEATGGAFGGDGGFAEISGKVNLDFVGRANVSAPKGDNGNILLDPENLIIATRQHLGIFNDPIPLDSGNVEYRSIALLESLIGDVTIEASGNIVIDKIDDGELRFNEGTNVTFTADSDQDGQGLFFMDSSDTLRAERGNLTITGAGIYAGILDTSTNAENVSSNLSGGDINLNSTGPIALKQIITSGDRSNNNSAANGGNVTITTTDLETGGIDITNGIDTQSYTSAMRSGVGGDITLTAQTGNIDIEGDLNSRSFAGSNSGQGGTIILTAENGTISTRNIFAHSEATQNNAGTSGNIIIDGTGFDAIGTLRANASTNGNNAGRGGNITINSETVDISGGLNTISQGASETQNGGNITITAKDRIHVGGDTIAYSAAYTGANSANGGNVILTSNQISTRDIGTQSSASAWSAIYNNGNAGNAGSLTLQEYSDTANINTSIDTGYIYTTSYARNNSSRNGGAVILAADNISTNGIQTFSWAGSNNAGNSGNVTLNAENNLSVGFGGINTRARSVNNTGSNSGAITLSGNSISLTGNDRILGESVLLRPGSLTQNIQIGDANTSSDPSTLAIGERTFRAIGNVNSLQIGDRNSTGTITAQTPNIVLPTAIEILGGEKLVGYEGNNTFDLRSVSEGSVSGSLLDIKPNSNNIRFSNIEQISGGSGGSNVIVSKLPENTWEITGLNQGRLIQDDRTLLSFEAINRIDHASVNIDTPRTNRVSFLNDTAQITTSISSGINDLILTGNRLAVGERVGNAFVGGNISGQGQLFIQPLNNDAPIELGNVLETDPSTLLITQSEIDAIDHRFTQVSIGTPDTDSIQLNDTVTFHNNVSLRAEGDITSNLLEENTRADIISEGGIALTSEAGQIQVGTIRTNNADVSISSPGSIEIEIIDTTPLTETDENGRVNSSTITIDTQSTFVATGSDLNGNSLITSGRQENAVNISYGNPDQLAAPFTTDTNNRALNSSGTSGSIKTGSSTTAPFSAFNSASSTIGNIQITNRGNFQITSEPSEPEIINTNTIVAAATSAITTEQTSVSNVHYNSSAAELEEFSALFTQIETGVSTDFNRYLGISDSDATPPATITEIQDTLNAVEQGTSVTPAVVYVYFVPDAGSEDAIVAGSQHTPQPEDQLEVMVVTKDDIPVRLRRWGITRAQLDAASRELRQQVTSEFSTAKQYLPPAQQLYDWIVKPIEDTLQSRGIDSLGFVMDTGLRTLPIATLHTGDRYLIEDYSLGILPTFSLTDFSSTVASTSSAQTDFSTAQVLAMGASTFKNQPDLPAVNAEVKLIAEDLWEGDAFLNEDFVLSNLQTQLQNNDYGIVHLATHAVFEPGDLDSSYIQLWDEQLSLSQISELQLSKADIGLIILSACSTALGDAASEYGFAGFAVNSGSPSALASIWPVNDEGTLGFMSQFYQQLRTASARTEALRQTQLSMLSGAVGIENGTVYGPNEATIAQLPELTNSGQWDFSHPFYWSAFTMIGNPW